MGLEFRALTDNYESIYALGQGEIGSGRVMMSSGLEIIVC